MKEVTEERMNSALDYLANTDKPCAEAKSLAEGRKEHKKTILAVEFLKATGTGQEKDAKSHSSEAYREWQTQYEAAVLDYETMRNRRTTATLLVEVWRSLNSNRRQAGGNL